MTNTFNYFLKNLGGVVVGAVVVVVHLRGHKHVFERKNMASVLGLQVRQGDGHFAHSALGPFSKTWATLPILFSHRVLVLSTYCSTATSLPLVRPLLTKGFHIWLK